MTYIIAEIGINFDGKFKKAKKLIKLAKLCGVDAVKFQIFKAETLAREDSKKTIDQKKTLVKKENLSKMWKKMELNEKQISLLSLIAKKNNLDFLCSVFDSESLKKTKKYVNAIKIASSDITDIELIKEIAKTKKKVILSTGMANYKEIKNILKYLKKNKVILLHCVSLYPCPEDLVNLKRMTTLKKKFNLQVGYSDHSIGNYASYAAISMGAKVLEKHFTDNKKIKGADHLLSADVVDMTKIVNFSKKLNKMNGDGLISPSTKEGKMKKFFRKSIYYKSDSKKGTIISKENIFVARPFKYICSSNVKYILGKKIKKNSKANMPIKYSDF